MCVCICKYKCMYMYMTICASFTTHTIAYMYGILHNHCILYISNVSCVPLYTRAKLSWSGNLCQFS